VSVVNVGASPTTSVDARPHGAPAQKSNLSLYQARARASALRGTAAARTRHIRIVNDAGRQLSDNPNLAYYQAQAWALVVGMTETEPDQLVDLDLAGFLSATTDMSPEDLRQSAVTPWSSTSCIGSRRPPKVGSSSRRPRGTTSPKRE
jgi:hypothetical protein